MKPRRLLTLIGICSLAIASRLLAADATLSIDCQTPGHPISPRLYGIFFEDINFGGDGGLNAELVKNGAFEIGQRYGLDRPGNSQLERATGLAANPITCGEADGAASTPASAAWASAKARSTFFRGSRGARHGEASPRVLRRVARADEQVLAEATHPVPAPSGSKCD